MELTDLPGVGPATADKLRAAGYATVQTVAKANATEIVASIGGSLERAQSWIDAGRGAAKPAAVDPEDGPIGTRRPFSGGQLTMDIIMGFNVAWIALNVLGAILVTILTWVGVDLLASSGELSPETTRRLLWATNVHNLWVFAIIPLLWLRVGLRGKWAGVREYLGLHWTWLGALWAGIMAVGLVVVFVGISYLMEALGLVPETEAPIEEALAGITWPLVIVTSLVAGFAEEIMFRGVLQKWTNWWVQGVIFGLLHLGNAGLISFAATAMIGILFGYLRHRGASLWILIIAHAFYDLILLSSLMLMPEASGEPAWMRWPGN